MKIVATIIIARIKRIAITADTAIPAMMLPLRLEPAENGIKSVGEDIQYHNSHLGIEL